MRALLLQVIVILILLLTGFVLFKKWGLSDSKELGRLQSELQSLNSKNEELSKLNQKLETENDQLKLANRFLKTDHRKARIEVLEQKTAEGTDGQPPRILETKIRFTEFDPVTGAIIAKPQEFTVAGDMVYVSALVVKFDDIFVETSDPLKIFGEDQPPSEGFRIDAEDRIPSVYSSGNENEEAKAIEKKIWDHFWEFSNSPEAQKEMGIRAIHGEAPFQRLEPGRIYNLYLRASDGLTFTVQ